MAIVQKFWTRAFQLLAQHQIGLSVPQVADAPLFHLRLYGDQDGHAGYNEVFRLERSCAGTSLTEDLRLAAVQAGAVAAAWRTWTPEGYANQFWTFLQALSVLRLRDRMWHPRWLAGKSMAEKREAYDEMRKPDPRWSTALAPWFQHLDSVQSGSAPREDVLDYGHWFGHILSNRFKE